MKDNDCPFGQCTLTLEAKSRGVWRMPTTSLLIDVLLHLKLVQFPCPRLILLYKERVHRERKCLRSREHFVKVTKLCQAQHELCILRKQHFAEQLPSSHKSYVVSTIHSEDNCKMTHETRTLETSKYNQFRSELKLLP